MHLYSWTSLQKPPWGQKKVAVVFPFTLKCLPCYRLPCSRFCLVMQRSSPNPNRQGRSVKWRNKDSWLGDNCQAAYNCKIQTTKYMRNAEKDVNSDWMLSTEPKVLKHGRVNSYPKKKGKTCLSLWVACRLRAVVSTFFFFEDRGVSQLLCGQKSHETRSSASCGSAAYVWMCNITYIVKK